MRSHILFFYTPFHVLADLDLDLWQRRKEPDLVLHFLWFSFVMLIYLCLCVPYLAQYIHDASQLLCLHVVFFLCVNYIFELVLVAEVYLNQFLMGFRYELVFVEHSKIVMNGALYIQMMQFIFRERNIHIYAPSHFDGC